ncbi:Integral membrane protein, partial [human gut metagenome]
PILVLLAPAWWIAPSPLTLLIVQDLLLAVSAWPLTRLATRCLGAVGGTLLGLVYVLSWGLQTAVAAQFHEIAFAVPLLAWASAAFAEDHWWAVAGWS